MRLLSKSMGTVKKYLGHFITERYNLAPLTTEYNFRFRAQKIRSKVAGATKFPLLLHVEGTNIFNARCVFCAYRKMERSREIMDLRLFEAVIDEYQSLGGRHVSLTPIVGDPFLDPFLFARLDYLCNCVNIERFYFYTNGILMKPNAIEKLLQYDGKLSIYISIGGFDRETYKEIIGVDAFERVCKNVDSFIEVKLRLGSRTRLFIVLRCPPSNWRGETWERFRKYESEKHLAIIRSIHYDSWAGTIKPKDLRSVGLKPAPIPHKRGECCMLYGRPIVLANGMVNACACRDVNAELIIGNIRGSSLEEIWNGEERRNIISLHRDGDYPEVCKRCTYYISVYDSRALGWLSIRD